MFSLHQAGRGRTGLLDLDRELKIYSARLQNLCPPSFEKTCKERITGSEIALEIKIFLRK